MAAEYRWKIDKDYISDGESVGVEGPNDLDENVSDNPQGFTEGVTSETFIRSLYFFDPNGVALEFAANTRAFDERDVAHEPAQSARS